MCQAPLSCDSLGRGSESVGYEPAMKFDLDNPRDLVIVVVVVLFIAWYFMEQGRIAERCESRG